MSDLIRREDVQREIQTSFDEGAFRWQDGQDMMNRINALPTASPWHRVEEPPKKTGKYAVCWTYQEKIYWDWLIFIDGNWQLQAGLPLPNYWMPIEPPKEDA